MGWSWQALQDTPAHVVDDVVSLMRAESQAAMDAQGKGKDKDKQYLARTEARGLRR
jgi:hypothetical protein